MSDPLTRVLDEEPPASVLALPVEVRQRIADLTLAAREAHGRAEEEALTASMAGLPAPLAALLERVLR